MYFSDYYDVLELGAGGKCVCVCVCAWGNTNQTHILNVTGVAFKTEMLQNILNSNDKHIMDFVISFIEKLYFGVCPVQPYLKFSPLTVVVLWMNSACSVEMDTENITGPHVLLLQSQIIPLNIFSKQEFWKHQIIWVRYYVSDTILTSHFIF